MTEDNAARFWCFSCTKCPHFDVSKSANLELFLTTYKKIKMTTTLETLKPSAKAAINKMASFNGT